jgi:cell division septum initiation protein DivIVA
VDITQRIDALAEVLAAGKSRTLGGGAVVDREKALRIIDDIRASLPTELDRAGEVIASATTIQNNAQVKADSLLAEAQLRCEMLASESEVALQATTKAAQIIAQGEAEAAHKRAEVDAYVDSKLAAFEGTLTSTLESVHHGRQKLASVPLVEPAENPA